MRFIRKPIVLLMAVVLGLVLVGLPFLGYPEAQPGISLSAPYKGAIAPLISAENADGDFVSLNELEGKIVVLNFWASWCPPCRAEMQAFQRISENYNPNQVVVIGLNATKQDDRETALAFVADEGITFSIWLDPTGENARNYQVRAMPTTFFIRPSGEIASVMIGGPLDEAVIAVTIENMLKEVEE